MIMSVYLVQHVHSVPSDGEEDVKFIGAYTTEAEAQAAVDRLSPMPGFCEHVHG